MSEPTQKLRSILDVKMVFSNCLQTFRLGDCNCDDETEEGDGAIGCPVPDCGGVMVEVPQD